MSMLSLSSARLRTISEAASWHNAVCNLYHCFFYMSAAAMVSQLFPKSSRLAANRADADSSTCNPNSYRCKRAQALLYDQRIYAHIILFSTNSPSGMHRNVATAYPAHSASKHEATQYPSALRSTTISMHVPTSWLLWAFARVLHRLWLRGNNQPAVPMRSDGTMLVRQPLATHIPAAVVGPTATGDRRVGFASPSSRGLYAPVFYRPCGRSQCPVCANITTALSKRMMLGAASSAAHRRHWRWTPGERPAG